MRSEEESLMANMFYYSFYQKAPHEEGFDSIEAGINYVVSVPEIKEEILQILDYNRQHLTAMELCMIWTIHPHYVFMRVIILTR